MTGRSGCGEDTAVSSGEPTSSRRGRTAVGNRPGSAYVRDMYLTNSFADTPTSRRARTARSRAAGRRAWLWLALLVGGLAGPARAQTLYQLVEGSLWTPAELIPSLPVRGSFRLMPQPGPLDWEQFAVERVHLEAVAPGDPPRVWRGSGFYRRGGRGPFFGHEMWLELDDGHGPVRFESGLQPVGDELDLTLTTPDPAGPSLRLVAVPELSRWAYRLLADSRFVNDCLVCGRPVIPVPLTGGFDLVHSGGNPLFERYHVFHLRLTDGAEPPGLEITGEGTLELGGEVAVQQKWNLTLRVRTGDAVRLASFRNSDPAPGREWPLLGAEFEEQGGDEFSRFFVSLRAAPFRELWFTTRHGMTPGAGSWPEARLTGADLLSDTGRLVVPWARLLKAAGLGPEVGVDGLDVVPGSGGQVAFSIGQAAESPALGHVSEGDLLSSTGRMLLRNADLVDRLGFMPPVPELGLDAVFWHESGEIWFSVRKAAWSETLSHMVSRGDLLSNAGRVVRSNAGLLRNFAPENPEHDYGLDAFFVWPSGEIWFSVEEGFMDARLGAITDGDLLSDRGYLVACNLDLVRPFQPLEDLANFGLEGLWVVSDAVPPAGPPKLQLPVIIPGGLELRWQGPSRVFQVESAPRLDDPFAPLSEILAADQWTAPAAGPAGPAGFYRLRAW